jgi:hypothetical protein
MNNMRLAGYMEGYMTKAAAFDYRSLLGAPGKYQLDFDASDKDSTKFTPEFGDKGEMTGYGTTGIGNTPIAGIKDDPSEALQILANKIPGFKEAIANNDYAKIRQYLEKPFGPMLPGLESVLPNYKLSRSYNPDWRHYTGAAGIGGGLGAGVGALAAGPGRRGLGALVGGGFGAMTAPALLYLAKRMGALNRTIAKGPGTPAKPKKEESKEKTNE